MTIRAGDVLFVDTNVLLSATDRARRGYPRARRLLQAAATAGYHLALSGQILREYLTAATRPVEVNGLGLPAADALRNVDVFASPPTWFCDEPEEVSRYLRGLVSRHDLRGPRIHDANVVATMAVHGIDRLVTDNEGDFRAFDVETITLDQLPEEETP